MNIEFQNPLYLLLLIPLLCFVCWPLFKLIKRKKMTGRHIASFACRILAVIMLVSAIAGFTTVRKSKKSAVIVVADLSDSARNSVQKYEEYVKIAQKYKNRNTFVGLVTFGYDSYYEIPLTSEIGFKKFETDPAGNYTDIYSALVKASAMFPSDCSKRIVLLTDGKENIGNLRDAAAMLSRRNIRLDAIVTDSPTVEGEIQLTSIDTPEILYSGEEYTVTVTVESMSDCSAVLSLFNDNSLAAKQEVKLTKGTNRFVFNNVAESSGITTFSAEISSEGDSLKKNNAVYTFIKVLGTPKLLIVDGSGEESHELVKIIGDKAQITVCRPETVPNTINDLRKYSGIILMNTSKDSLPDGWDSIAEVYVRQLGRGMLVTGGDRSYALGGWADSDLEKALPVDMIVKDEQKIIDIALMLLIDNSGSMAGEYTEGEKNSPLELAKQGAVNSVGALRSIDEVGVIAFSDNANWVSKLTSGKNKKDVQSKISKIALGGGTMIYSALYESYNALVKSDKNQKRIILLTDGQPADGDKVVSTGLLRKMVEEGIIISSIAVGDYAETSLLNYLAKETGGTVTVVRDSAKLPDVIFEETMKAMNDGYLINETFTPQKKDYSPVTAGISKIPELDGYVLTEMKDLAFNLIENDEEKTVLASWQYGLGRTMALTVDLNGKWSSKLLSSEEGRELIKNAVSWILPSDDGEETGTVNINREGDKGIITVTSPDKENTYKTAAVIVSPSGEETETELSQTGIGEYSGEFFLNEEGSYVVVVTQKDAEGKAVMNNESALAVKYSDEYDMFVQRSDAVDETCEKTGGRADWSKIEDILNVKTQSIKTGLSYTLPLIIIALCLMMADIALRRLNIFNILAEKAAEKKKKKAAAAAEKKTEEKKPVKEPVKEPAKEPAKEKKGSAAYAAQTAAADDSKVKKEKKKEKNKKEEPEKDYSGSSVSALLKEKENMKRKKM